MLPPGQFDLKDFPRFGLPEYKNRFPKIPDQVALKVGGDIRHPIHVTNEFTELPRHNQVSDFHCVTTWSATGLRWEGVLFKTFFEELVCQRVGPHSDVAFVNIKCQDGYRSCLPLEDMLRDNVILADHLNGKPLDIAHGAPLRLVAPDHYGYKSAKHISEINFHIAEVRPKTAFTRFLAHPRGRVELEERAAGVPGWLLRYPYRSLIDSTRKSFSEALRKHQSGKSPKAEADSSLR